ncbi:MAG: efflux RND transporter permease subunit [Gammaproteobacteria bacterium]|nr:efflux RND transporter permease subunit [Gammaproteobacteria bacterium]
MNTLIDAAFARPKVVILMLLAILVAGLSAYPAIPKESTPDVAIPIVYVSMVHEGISPEDAERLLVLPMERELQSIEGLKEMSAIASEGHASVTLEFDAGFDIDQAIDDVREQVDRARVELPPDTLEPTVNEVNLSEFPVLSVSLSGRVSERTLITIARDLQDRIEGQPNVLEVTIGGDREEMLEVIIDPSVLDAYQLSFQDISNLVSSNNQLIAAGVLDTGAGRMILKVPGVVSELEDIMTMPVKVLDDRVVTFQDLASVRRTYKDPESFARIDGENAVVLEVSKRTGANIIETIESVRILVTQAQASWPSSINVTYLLDESDQIETMLGDLENNVITAIILVMVVVVAALGVGPALLVGLAIPGSFLAGILILYMMGLTMNMIVLFALILVVGMLVDGAIITIELAERLKSEGLTSKAAFSQAAKRMSWPIIASTATTLSVFMPLLFWPGMVGEFMKYMPITVSITLVASLFMALCFIPVVGGIFGRNVSTATIANSKNRQAQHQSAKAAKGLNLKFLRVLWTLLKHPGKVFTVSILLLVGSFVAFGKYGSGVEFFPSTEPEFIQVQVHARGDLSIFEKDQIMSNVEDLLLNMDYLDAVYTRTTNGGGQGANAGTEDTIGVVQLDFVDWDLRPPAVELEKVVRSLLATVPGIQIDINSQEKGPPTGKPLQLEVSSIDYPKLNTTVALILDAMNEVGGFTNIEDTRALPGIEWELLVNREEAARYGADISSLGSVVQLLTTGLKLSEYQPDDADEELDIRLRFNDENRNMEQLNQLNIPTPNGLIPIGNFLQFETSQKTGTINRLDGARTLTIQADVEDGLLAATQSSLLRDLLLESSIDPAVNIAFAGQDENQSEASSFLGKAFAVALVIMMGILLIQFNSFYQSFLVISAVIFSTAGVLIFLTLTGQPFGIVMCGVGIIALAGIVVNNNIVLIDTFNEIRRDTDYSVKRAVIETVAQRIRPVLLTSSTTILGLLPMVFAITINLIERDVLIGAPSSQMWVQLSSSIAGGLLFATLLTLVFTPCMLVLGGRFSKTKRIVPPETNRQASNLKPIPQN